MDYEMQGMTQQKKGLTVDDLWDRLIWLLTAVLFATFYIANTSAYGSYILIGITALVMLLMIVKNNGKMRISFSLFHGFVLAFAAYSAMTALWARNPVDATTKATTILEILICMTVLYWYYVQQDSTEKLLKAGMWGAYIVVLYTLMQYGVNGIINAVENEERFVVEFANINSVAMVAAIAVVLNVHLFRRKTQRLAIVFSLPALLLIGASGSRKALIMVIIGIILVFLLDMKSRSAITKMLKIVGFVLLAIAVVRLVLTIPAFKVAARRMDTMFQGLLGLGETDSSTQKRMEFVDVGWDLFLEHPLFGVGISNPHIYVGERIGEDVYLHNNFVEILAGGGIVGFVIYYAQFFYLIVQMIKIKLRTHPHSVMIITRLILLLIMDWGSVNYYSKGTYFWLMVFFVHIANIKKQSQVNIDQ